jgi:hypothetical protein
MRTQLQDGIVQPRRMFDLSITSSVPRSYKQAMTDPNWLDAMRSEYDALVHNNTWTLVSPPPGANIVSGKWVFRIKYNSDGALSLL